jgi:hypothetical protein
MSELKLCEHYIDITLDSIPTITLNSWRDFIEVEYDEEAESDFFYWSSDAPEEAKKFDACDVFYIRR